MYRLNYIKVIRVQCATTIQTAIEQSNEEEKKIAKTDIGCETKFA